MTAHFSAELRRTTVIFSPSRPTPTHQRGGEGVGGRRVRGEVKGLIVLNINKWGQLFSYQLVAGGWYGG